MLEMYDVVTSRMASFWDYSYSVVCVISLTVPWIVWWCAGLWFSW